tara:strand:- start:195 stop:449 length:255 start_codon:yes stop_codon:yes gene_type:complete
MNFSTNVVLKELDDGLIILNFSNGHYLETNQLGKTIIEMIKDGKTIQNIFDIISAEYSVDRNIIEDDIKNFIEDLKKKNLFEYD